MHSVSVSVIAAVSIAILNLAASDGLVDVSSETRSLRVGACTEVDDLTKCHYKCIRQDCGFQSYLCETNPTCTPGEEFTPTVIKARCANPPSGQEDKRCHLDCVTFDGYLCKIDPDPDTPNNTAQCAPGKERCPLVDFKDPGDEGAPEVTVEVEQGNSKLCEGSANSDPKYACPQS